MSTGGYGGTLLGIVAVIWSPVRVLQEVAEERRAFPGFVVVAVYAALSLVASTALVLSGVTSRQIEQQSAPPGLPPGFEETVAGLAGVGIPLFAAVSPFLTWIVVSLLMQLTTGFFGGAGPFSSMLGVVGVAQVPSFISGLLGTVLTGSQLLVGVGTPAGVTLGYLASLLGLAFSVWYVVLVVIGAALARGVGYGESAGSCALSCVGLGILIIVLVIVAAIGIFTATGAAAQ